MEGIDSEVFARVVARVLIRAMSICKTRQFNPQTPEKPPIRRRDQDPPADLSPPAGVEGRR